MLLDIEAILWVHRLLKKEALDWVQEEPRF